MHALYSCKPSLLIFIIMFALILRNRQTLPVAWHQNTYIGFIVPSFGRLSAWTQLE